MNQRRRKEQRRTSHTNTQNLNPTAATVDAPAAALARIDPRRSPWH